MPNEFKIKTSVTVSGILTATDVTSTSDIKFKENIVTITDPLAKVLNLRGVTYTRNDTDDGKTHIGVIAQEIEKILPEVVSESKDGTKSVAYSNIVSLLIEAIKELNEKVNLLEAKVSTLENQNNTK